MPVAGSSVLTLVPMTNGRTRVSFLIGDHPPDQMTAEDSDREAVFCSIVLDAKELFLLPALEREALERARDMIEAKLQLVADALRASRSRRQ